MIDPTNQKMLKCRLSGPAFMKYKQQQMPVAALVSS